jgi:hypothetical protein
MAAAWQAGTTTLLDVPARQTRIFKLLRSPRIDSKEPILPGCVAWRAGTTLFLLDSSTGYTGWWNRFLGFLNFYNYTKLSFSEY